MQAADPRLDFKVTLEPLRPMRVPGELVIEKDSGGRWRYDLLLEALEPDIDDVIHMEAALQRPSSVSFRLTNHFPAYAEFTAFFTPESSFEFTVTPTSGILEPLGSEGTNLIVSFTPTEYGKTRIGRLVIQTEEMQWSYEVRGTHPHYVAPVIHGTRIDNRLREDVESKLRQPVRSKNYLKENMKTKELLAQTKKK
eukprot:GILI01004025.1.p2 GENE.GILI01004025.1~~GILI01004025.1.p2  ORF type:complete len:196 (+),score=74.20 GILI01004025.1:2-589(+)